MIGYCDVLDYDDWEGFPETLVVVPGNQVVELNCTDVSDKAEFFVHTPFREHTVEGSRNSSSLGIQLTLHTGDGDSQDLRGDSAQPKRPDEGRGASAVMSGVSPARWRCGSG